MPDFSIVIPVYFNEGSLEYTANRIFAEVFAIYKEKRGEIVFVDDGSGDGSFDELKRIQSVHSDEVRIIKLSRNFGQVNAIWCGLEHTDSRPVVIISADGQDPIDLIPQMLRSYYEGGNEVVICTRTSREESLWRRWTSSLVYGVIRRLGSKDMPFGGFDFLLLGSKAKIALVKTWQPNTFSRLGCLIWALPVR